MTDRYYFYILRCKDGSLYSGATFSLQKRINLHNQGKASKYTRAKRPVGLVYSETFSDFGSARKRENEVKNWSKKKKEQLIAESGFPRPLASGLPRQ